MCLTMVKLMNGCINEKGKDVKEYGIVIVTFRSRHSNKGKHFLTCKRSMTGQEASQELPCKLSIYCQRSTTWCHHTSAALRRNTPSLLLPS